MLFQLNFVKHVLLSFSTLMLKIIEEKLHDLKEMGWNVGTMEGVGGGERVRTGIGI